MKNYRLFFIPAMFALLVLASCGGAVNESKPLVDTDTLRAIHPDSIQEPTDTDPYAFESGVIVYTSTTMGIEQSVTLWFRDFGRNSCSEITSDMFGQKSHNISLISDTMLYNIDMVVKEGVRSKIKSDSGDAPNYRNMTPEEMTEHRITSCPDEKVLDKNCKVFDMVKSVNGMEVKAKVWVWEGIPLKTVSVVSGIEVTLEAKDIKVNVHIPASKFSVPDGVKLTDEKPDSLALPS